MDLDDTSTTELDRDVQYASGLRAPRSPAPELKLAGLAPPPQRQPAQPQGGDFAISPQGQYEAWLKNRGQGDNNQINESGKFGKAGFQPQSSASPNNGQIVPGEGGAAPAATPADKRVFNYVNRVVGSESGGDPTAANPGSSARGLGQFIKETWRDMVRGEPEAAGKSDAEILAMRTDPRYADLNKRMTAKYAAQNSQALQKAGLPTSDGNLYLAHFAGPGGAVAILKADPDKPVDQILDAKAIEANPQLKGATAGGLARWAMMKMAGDEHGAALSMDLESQLRRDADQERSRHSSAMSDAQRLQGEYSDAADKEALGSAERTRLLREARDAARRAEESFADLRKVPPTYKPADAAEQFGSLAVILAGLGGLFARRSLTASLGAAGDAMMALNQKKYDEYKIAYDQWQKQLDFGLQQVKMSKEDIRDVLEDDRLSYEQKKQKLAEKQAEWGMSKFTVEEADKRLDHIETSLTKITEAKERIRQQNNLIESRREIAKMQSEGKEPWAAAYREWLEGEIAVGRIPDAPERNSMREQFLKQFPRGSGANVAKNAAAQSFIEESIAKTGHPPTYQDWVKFSHDTKGSATGELSPDAVNMLAQQYEMGDPAVITSLPRGGPARIQVENKVAEDMRNLEGGLEGGAAKIVMNRLRMAEARSAAQTAGRITMTTELYATEAIGAGRQVVETSKLFERTNLPSINAALQAFEKGTGDPNVIRFGVALNALVNAYGKMSNPTGTGVHDADKERIVKILDTTLAQGQIEAGVDQVITEGKVISNAAHEAQVKALAGLAPTAPGTQPMPTQSQPGAAAPGSVSIPQTAIDYLRQHPEAKSDFDAKYGTGSAARALGK